MARVTVEDCLDKVSNPFDLVVLAAQRARALARGDTPTQPREQDKNTVVALREIAAGTVDPAILADDAGRNALGLAPDPFAAVDFDGTEEPLDFSAPDEDEDPRGVRAGDFGDDVISLLDRLRDGEVAEHRLADSAPA